MPWGDRQCAMGTAANLMAQFKFTWQSWSSLQAAFEKGLFTLALYFWMHFSSCAAAQLPNTEGLCTIIKRFNFFSLASPSLHLVLIGRCSDRASFQTTQHKHRVENNSIDKKWEQKPKNLCWLQKQKRMVLLKLTLCWGPIFLWKFDAVFPFSSWKSPQRNNPSLCALGLWNARALEEKRRIWN